MSTAQDLLGDMLAEAEAQTRYDQHRENHSAHADAENGEEVPA